MLLAATPVI